MKKVYTRKLNVKRIIKFSLVIIALVILILLMINTKSLSYKKIEYNEIYVSSGDTLWSIAKSEQKNNDYYKGKDIREIIHDIKKVNNLTNVELSVNQKILIPTL